ncbi:hypothetical protein CHUAL_001051 [Chamberlinius hualienensis]
MKFLILCAFAAALLAVANVNGLPVIPCQFAYEYIPDDYDCTVYYICNSELWPVEYQCAGLECWDQSSKICTTNRIACVPCQIVGQYIADDTNCTIFYHCDAALLPRVFQCPGEDCWDQRQKSCVSNRLECDCPITVSPLLN